MMSRHRSCAIALLVSGLFLGGCAVESTTIHTPAAPPSAPRDPFAQEGASAARLGLAPALRPLHDELLSYGTWVLVEPHGWVFRPRVNTVSWRPYQDGHWEPSYTFGWVWNSHEEFGWITDHYGFWFHDGFQGWVWKPYGAWAPAWVAWVQVGDFVGWAPLPPDDGASFTSVPGGVFTYVPANALTTGSHSSLTASFVSQVPDDGSDVRPLNQMASYRGVYWNAGPSLEGLLGRRTTELMRDEEVRNPPQPPQTRPRGLDASPEMQMERLSSRTRAAVVIARTELARARSARGGGGGSVTPPRPPSTPPSTPPAPGVAPRDTTERDSLLLRFPRGSRPPIPRRPGGR